MCGWYGESHIPWSDQRDVDLSWLERDEFGAYWSPGDRPTSRMTWGDGCEVIPSFTFSRETIIEEITRVMEGR